MALNIKKKKKKKKKKKNHFQIFKLWLCALRAPKNLGNFLTFAPPPQSEKWIDAADINM